jgi:type VI secretion system protein ImpC
VERVTQGIVDEMIANLDHRLSTQMDVILHNEQFQKLEAAWRSLKFLVDKTDFRENIKIEMLNVSKQDLLDDFEDAPEVTKSGLYKIAYTSEYGQFGGKPYGLMVSNYEFGPGAQDIRLLQHVAAVATMSHAPFVGAAGPEFFGLTDFSGLPNLKDLKSIFEMPQYIKWQSFRESEDARNVALTMPHFLLRLPYGPDTKPVKNFNFKENVSGGNNDFLWGNASFAFASRISDSFAQYRWCANIIGPPGGRSSRRSAHLPI